MKNKGKVLSTILIVMSVILISTSTYAHSGKTDSSGGHKDNKNKSGLGGYHYHCGGHPAHLHNNGVCPYSSKASSNKNNSSTSSTSTSKQTTKKTSTSSSSNKSSVSTSTKPNTKAKPTTIDVTGININEKIENIKVGESKKLTATILPENATDKSITWKSSDENIVEVNSNGEITAKKIGTVDITATSSNGKVSTIKINIKEEKVEDTNTIQTSVNIDNNTISNTPSSSEDSNAAAGLVTLGAIGGGSYLGYKKHKNKKKMEE